MKAFKFNLEQVLRMKRWREEEAKKALAVEVEALEKLKSRLSELQGELRYLWETDTHPGDGAEIDARGRLGILQYARHMGVLISSQQGDIAEQGERLKEKSDRLLKAMQERKVLEKLKERRREEYRQERLSKEYANLDEASAGYLRRLIDQDAGDQGADADPGSGADQNADLKEEVGK